MKNSDAGSLLLALMTVAVAGLLVLSAASYVSLAQKASVVPETLSSSEILEGVWILKYLDTPFYEEQWLPDGSSAPAIVGRTDWLLLVDPEISGDRVYLKKSGSTFVFKDMLVLADTPVYKILPGARSYMEGSVEGAQLKPDDDWVSVSPLDGPPHFPYLIGTYLRIKAGHPDRVYLALDEVPHPWKNKDGDWTHFFRREDVVLLNP